MDVPARADGFFVLADLVSLWEVGIEIVFSAKRQTGAISAPTASPILKVNSMTSRFKTGNTPGSPKSTVQVCSLGPPRMRSSSHKRFCFSYSAGHVLRDR